MRRSDSVRVLTLLLCALALSAEAVACGPSRQKAVESIEIDAPTDKVWALIGNFRDMTWHPAIAATDADATLEPEVTKRRLIAKGGALITDRLTKYDPAAHSIGFMTDEADQSVLPVTGYNSTLTVRDIGGKTYLEWRGAFSRGYLKADPPPDQNDEAALRAVTAFQHAGLEALKRQLEDRKAGGS